LATLRIGRQDIVLVGAVPAQNYDGIGAGLGLILAMVERTSNRIVRVAIVVEDEIRVAASALEPAANTVAIFIERDAHSMFGGLPIGIG
jgi:hypothetical protein